MSTLQSDVQFQQQTSRAYTSTSCSKICQKFWFLILDTRICMQIRKKFNNHLFVFFVDFVCIVYFAEILYSLWNIKKSEILIFNNLRVSHRINAFVSLFFDTRNCIKAKEDCNVQTLVYFFAHIFSNFRSKTSRILSSEVTSHYEWSHSHV